MLRMLRLTMTSNRGFTITNGTETWSLNLQHETSSQGTNQRLQMRTRETAILRITTQLSDPDNMRHED